MCGIYCCVAHTDISREVLDGLQRLEYRGYDSAGIAWPEGEKLRVIKSLGRIHHLIGEVNNERVSSNLILGHTRWATHGQCTLDNAHPHTSGDELTIVHNGIIENYLELQVELQNLGYTFKSSTDTEVLAHLLHLCLEENPDPNIAIRKCLKRIEGNYAFVVCFRRFPGKLFGVCNGSPLVIGLKKDALFLSSDIAALTPVTSQMIYLQDENIFSGNAEEYQLLDFAGRVLDAEIIETRLSKQILDLGVYHNYTEKEIFEQPQAAIDTIKSRIVDDEIVADICGEGSDEILKQIDEIQIVGCGSSFHAGLVSQHWFEGIAKIPCRVDIASEFTSRRPVGRGKQMLILVSQSGETADTINALRVAESVGYFMKLCISNVEQSALTRMSDFSLMTHAGPEIGVATTKALTTQMICLLMLATRMAQLRLPEPTPEIKTAISGLLELPNHISRALKLDDEVIRLCPEISSKEHVMFLGKGIHFPVAMEGSLKLKELSYIHAEAYAAGELKHGPLALVDYRTSVIAVAPNNALLSKLKNNLNEVRARHGRLIVFADQEISFDEKHDDEIVVHLSAPNRLTSPIVHIIPLQLLAYHVSMNIGVDVDKPRNLAKSVTVE